MCSKEQHFTLSDSDRSKFLSLSQRYANSYNFYEDAQRAAETLIPDVKAILPKAILNAIDNLKRGIGPQLISIHNLPVDNYLPSHDDLQQRIAEKTQVSEFCLLGINGLLEGNLQKEDSSHQLGFIHQVTPLKQSHDEASGRGAGSIPFHAENMFIKRPPSVLSLFCLQGEEGVATEYLYVDDIIHYLDQDSIEQLKKPLYTIITGDGFTRKELKDSAVLEHLYNGWCACRFYEEDRIYSDNDEAKLAIACLHRAIDKAKKQHTHSVELSSGSLLMFSNAIRKNHYGGVLHGRSGEMKVNVSSGPKTTSPRWLQRVCVELSYQI